MPTIKIDFYRLIKPFLTLPTCNIIKISKNKTADFIKTNLIETNNNTKNESIVIAHKTGFNFNFTTRNNKSIDFGGYLKKIRKSLFKQCKLKIKLRKSKTYLFSIFKIYEMRANFYRFIKRLLKINRSQMTSNR